MKKRSKIGEGKLPIRWDRLAKDHLDAIFEHIAKDSIPAAKMVKKELINLAHV